MTLKQQIKDKQLLLEAEETRKGARRPLEKANALHERNGLPSHGLHRSTIGDGELNCRVRHGTG